jgi:hypothetical protein
MGFQLSIVVSGPVDHLRKQAILEAARARWPFVRLPREDHLRQHAHFAPPELTDYLFKTTEAYERAMEENGLVEDYLSEWAESFPNVAFVFVEADCFGGTCLYRGYICKAGVLLAWQDSDLNGHTKLLDHIGINLDGGYFPPFARGYFSED